MIRTVTSAARLGPAAAIVVLFLGGAVITSGYSIGLGLGTPLLTSWLSALAVASACVVPLAATFPNLEGMFIRLPAAKSIRLGLASALAGPAFAVFATLDPMSALPLGLALFLAFGFLCAALAPEIAPLITLAFGGATVMVDHLVLNHPISSVLTRAGLPAASVILILTATFYVLWPQTGLPHKNG